MGKKSRHKREDRLIVGDAFLEESGVDVDAPDDELLPRLLELIGGNPEGDLAIADLLGSVPCQEAASRLTEWDAQKPRDKDLRRIIRASIFRLEQRGIAGAARARADEEPVRMAVRPEPTGWLSPIDGAGNRLAWLSLPRPEGGFLILSSLINDEAGMKQAGLRQANKGQFRGALEDVAAHSAPMVEAPHQWVDSLMMSAHRIAPPRNEPGGGYALMRGEFYHAAPKPAECPVHELMADYDAAKEPELLDRSADLLKQREFIGWVLPDEPMKVHQARFRDAQDSTLVLNKEQMKERLSGVIDKAFAEVFSGPARALYAARMREMALWYRLAGREEPARLSYAVHRAMAEEGRPPDRVSFLRALLLRSFAHLIPREPDDEHARPKDAGSSPIILPPE